MSIYKQHFHTHHYRIGAVLAVMAIIIGIFLWNTQEISLEAYATYIIAECANETYASACYDEAIPRLMDEGLSFEDTFAVTRIIQERDEHYWYCHVLGHNVSARETAKDPAAWADVVARCPTGMCSNGCLHGAFQERFRDDALSEEQIADLVPEISNICENGTGRNFTGLEQASCYHALGHLTMYITNADIVLSTGICDQVALKDGGERDFRALCYDGAYMQIFQPLEPEDIALVKDIAPNTQESAIAFCERFEGERRTSCMIESWPLFIDNILESSEAVDNFCSGRNFDKKGERRCYNGIFYILAARLSFDIERIAPVCNGLSEVRRAQCYANAASRFVETDYALSDQAVALCERAREQGFGDRCFDELLFYSSYNFHRDSEAFKNMCAALPDPWRTRCIERDESVTPFGKDE